MKYVLLEIERQFIWYFFFIASPTITITTKLQIRFYQKVTNFICASYVLIIYSTLSYMRDTGQYIRNINFLYVIYTSYKSNTNVISIYSAYMRHIRLSFRYIRNDISYTSYVTIISHMFYNLAIYIGHFAHVFNGILHMMHSE